jgi:hypothetical protein
MGYFWSHRNEQIFTCALAPTKISMHGIFYALKIIKRCSIYKTTFAAYLLGGVKNKEKFIVMNALCTGWI